MKTNFWIVDLVLVANDPIAVGSNVDTDAGPRAQPDDDESERGDEQPTLKRLARTHDDALVVPATGIAGALADLAARIGFSEDESTGLFGAVDDRTKRRRDSSVDGPPIDEDNSEVVLPSSVVSRLDISDALLVPKTWVVQKRSRTVIDRSTGGSAYGLLFTVEEAIPKPDPARDHLGGEIELRIEIDLTGDAGGETRDLAQRLLTALADFGLTVGAGSRSGAGRLVLDNIGIQEVDLSSLEHLETFAASGAGEFLPKVRSFIDVPFEHPAFLNDQSADESDEPLSDGPERSRAFDGLRYTLTIRPIEPYGSTLPPGAATSDSDGAAERANVIRMEQVRSGGGFRGTSVRGALRSRAERIARTLGCEVWEVAHGAGRSGSLNQSDPVTVAFGSTGRAGLVTVHDVVPSPTATTKSSVVEFHHVAIDRFTGGAADEHLFSVEAHVGGELTLTVDVEYRNDVDEFAGACGLVLLTLLDVATGDLPLGGLTRRGYGTFCGTQLTASIENASRRTDWLEKFASPFGDLKRCDDFASTQIEDASSVSELPDREAFLPAADTAWGKLLLSCVEQFAEAVTPRQGEGAPR